MRYGDDSMILLTSNGLSSKDLIDYMKKYISNDIKKAVIITTASLEYKEKDWHIPKLVTELGLLGLSVEFFDFDIQKPEDLYKYDVIEINGGNPFYLLKAIRNSKGEQVLAEIAKSKVLIGISAGSVVLQKNIELVYKYSPELNRNVCLSDLRGLGLTEIEILPHYHKYINKFERFEEKAAEYERNNNCRVIRIDDGQGIFVNEDGYKLL